ncbi:YciC family protein [Buchnera aphidicola]|uniref:YciC family protein n=1 Tax=Buchnera aphidicola TaxID=9 RepID=UPI003463AA36
MLITKNMLYRDTRYFIYNNISYIILISFFITFFLILLNIFITPDIKKISFLYEGTAINLSELFDLINNMSVEQKMILLKLSLSKILSSIIGNTILFSSVISLINIVSSGKNVTFNLFFSVLKTSFNNLLLLIFVLIVIIKLSFICFFVPGILFSSFLSLSPIILSIENTSIFKSILFSFYIVYKRFKIIFPSLLLWLFLKFLFLSISLFFNISCLNITFLFLFFIQNFIFSSFIIHLFRFYMLFRIN